MELRVWPGRPYPCGATYDGSVSNYTPFSEAVKDEGGPPFCSGDEVSLEARSLMVLRHER